jgi:hypothetical protein
MGDAAWKRNDLMTGEVDRSAKFGEAQARPTFPDIDDMVKAGMPLWAAFQLWSEMMESCDIPAAHWWRKIIAWPQEFVTIQ